MAEKVVISQVTSHSYQSYPSIVTYMIDQSQSLTFIKKNCGR